MKLTPQMPKQAVPVVRAASTASTTAGVTPSFSLIPVPPFAADDAE